MKKIDSGHYTHLGYDVYYASHPKLSGAYEIYNGDVKETINNIASMYSRGLDY